MRTAPSGTVTFLFTDLDAAAAVHVAHAAQRGVSLRAASVGPQLDDHDLACVATKDALGRERYDDLVARGAVMSYEDAVPYALRELDALLASLS